MPDTTAQVQATATDFNLDDVETLRLIYRAQEADALDRSLTIKQALLKYKKAVFWAMFLSTTLVMEGYDLVIVSSCPISLLNTG